MTVNKLLQEINHNHTTHTTGYTLLFPCCLFTTLRVVCAFNRKSTCDMYVTRRSLHLRTQLTTVTSLLFDMLRYSPANVKSYKILQTYITRFCQKNFPGNYHKRLPTKNFLMSVVKVWYVVLCILITNMTRQERKAPFVYG